MQHHHAVIGEQPAALPEEFSEMPDADMFEHADRDDAIETLVEVAVILQTEIHPVRQLALGGAAAGELELFFRQRDAGDLCAAMFGEIETKAAPAAADVECALTLSHQQLCGQVPLLGELSVVERLFRRFEIGAAILPVGIQEQRIEPAVEIVMMRDIASRSRADGCTGRCAVGCSATWHAAAQGMEACHCLAARTGGRADRRSMPRSSTRSPFI